LYNQSNSLLATINVPSTGTAWQTVSVSVNLVAGSQTLVVKVNKSSGNPVFNWWEIASTSTISGIASVASSREITGAPDMYVYPKPVYNQLIVELNNNYNGQVKVQLWNMAGLLQKQFILNKTTIQSRDVLYLGDLSKGEYILLFEINNERRTEKIIKL
jgi:hypothetical protein